MASPIHCEVRIEDCKNSEEVMIRRFLRKCKKMDLFKEFRAHDYYKKPSEKRREKERQKERIIFSNKKKEEKKSDEDKNIRLGQKGKKPHRKGRTKENTIYTKHNTTPPKEAREKRSIKACIDQG